MSSEINSSDEIFEVGYLKQRTLKAFTLYNFVSTVGITTSSPATIKQQQKNRLGKGHIAIHG